jgi:hypothetical protein
MTEPFELPDLTDPNDADEETTRILSPDPALLSYGRASVNPVAPTERPPRMVN